MFFPPVCLIPRVYFVRRQELLLLLCGTQLLKLFGARFLLLALIFSAFAISWMDIPSSVEAFTPGKCNSFFWQRRSKLCSARSEDSILPFFNLFCLLDIFSAFYYLICFLIFCLAFRLDRSFLRYFAILIRFQFLVLPCFLSLNSWGRAASSERTIANFRVYVLWSNCFSARVLYDDGI